MKPLQSSNKLLSSVNNTTGFKMETSAETFEIFGNKIYEHKIRAVIRELCCNAYDAHVDAGKRDVPFRVHFPTMFEPYFEVEDFGVGLDDYDIRGEEVVLYDAEGEEVSRYMEGGIYTTYFASTKRESNDSIGYLGLGSKSPIAYTKSMTIIARKDGVERHYVCFIGEDGKPKITFNSEKETTESNGVRIRFSVAQADFEEFQREAAFVFSMFTLKPETNVEIKPMLTDSQLAEINDTGFLTLSELDEFVRHETGSVYAKMGSVIYPVRSIDYYYLSERVLVNEDAYNTGEDEEPVWYEFDKATVSFIKNVLGYGSKAIIVDYPLGDLAFLPSREGLSQDSKTKFNFYKGLVEAFYESVRELKSKIDAARSPLEAVNKFGEFTNPTDLHAYDYKWNGEAIPSVSTQYLDKGFKALSSLSYDDREKVIVHYEDTIGHYNWSGKTVVRKNMLLHKGVYDAYEWMKDQSTFECFYCNSEEDYRGLSKAIRFYVKEADGKKVFFLYTTFDKKVFKAIRDVFYGNVKFRHISELREDVLAIDPDFFTKKKKTKAGTAKRVNKKTETKAEMFRLDKKDDCVVHITSQVLINLDNLNRDRTAYVQKKPARECTGQFDYIVDLGNGRNKFISATSIKALMKLFDLSVVIVANGKNQGKIERSGITKFDTLVMDEVQAKRDTLIKAYAWEDSRDYNMRRSNDRINMLNRYAQDSTRIRYSYRDTVEMLYKNDEKFTKAAIDYHFNEIDAFIAEHKVEISSLENQLTQFIPFDDYKEQQKVIIDFNSEIREKLNQTFEAITARYPLLFGVDEDENAVLDYINLVNAKHNENLTKVA